MPKSTKGTNKNKRTKVKDLGRSRQELTSDEAKRVKGGMDPTNARGYGSDERETAFVHRS